ncbi:MAG: NAD(P)-dependent oxidoreductase [Chloroflexi bacterium]|nr:NAD(P)-dependent oxidoreductase [Chloroflexota bacterium]
MTGPVLITGGAGSMGRLVVNRLVADGKNVRVFDLPVANFSGLEEMPGIEIAKGDLTDGRDVQDATAGVSAVVHLAAILPPVAEANPELTNRVNVEGTRVLLQAATETAPDARFVFSSSVSVYGAGNTSGVVGTNNPVAPDDVYAESKAASEALVTASALDWAVVRISGVAIPVFQEPPAAWPFLADQQIEFVHRDDAVSALVAAVDSSNAAGKIFNIAGGPTWRMTGAKYVSDYFNLLEVDPEEAVYQALPGHFAWYDTADGQAALGYQNTPYETYLEQIQQAIDVLMGE